jgi:hypothetical protein
MLRDAAAAWQAGRDEDIRGAMSVPIEQLARLTAKLTADELRSELRGMMRDELQHVEREPGRGISARECPDRYGQGNARWWRDHKHEFGARPVGNGECPRWEFIPAEVERVLRERRGRLRAHPGTSDGCGWPVAPTSCVQSGA